MATCACNRMTVAVGLLVPLCQGGLAVHVAKNALVWAETLLQRYALSMNFSRLRETQGSAPSCPPSGVGTAEPPMPALTVCAEWRKQLTA